MAGYTSSRNDGGGKLHPDAGSLVAVAIAISSELIMLSHAL